MKEISPEDVQIGDTIEARTLIGGLYGIPMQRTAKVEAKFQGYPGCYRYLDDDGLTIVDGDLHGVVYYLVHRPKPRIPTSVPATIKLSDGDFFYLLKKDGWVNPSGTYYSAEEVQELADKHGFEVL